jgi:hypothetical protein
MAERRIITKFFPADFIEHYERGSISFGTALGYRNAEQRGNAVEERFSDEREGLVQQALHVPQNTPVTGTVPGAQFNNTIFRNFDVDIMIFTDVNEYVFCACWGGYTEEMHAAMRDGVTYPDGSRYKGDPKLTSYAEIDVSAFLTEIATLAPQHSKWRTRAPCREFLASGKVTYDDPRVHYQTSAKFNAQEYDLGMSEYCRTLFSKPPHYRAEREFRVILRGNAPGSVAESERQLLLQSDGLRRAIKLPK